MKYLLLFLAFAACGQKEQTSTHRFLISKNIKTNFGGSSSTAPNHKELDAQIVKDFQPYLKYFHRENLSPYAVLPNGNIIMYTNAYGMGFPNTNKIGFTREELPRYLYDIELGFLDAYNLLATNSKNSLSNLDTLAELMSEKLVNDYIFDKPYALFNNSLTFIYRDILSDITVSPWIEFPKEADEDGVRFRYGDPEALRDAKETSFLIEWLTLTYGVKEFPSPMPGDIKHIRRYLACFYTDDNFDIAMVNWFLTRTLFIKGEYSPFPPLAHEAELLQISEERVRANPQLTNIYKNITIIPAKKIH